MNITHLRTFLAIRNTGSLIGAAGAVHLSHSAISVQMKQFESAIGTQLFIKGKRPATLTVLGEAVARDAEEITARIDALSNFSQTDDTTGQIRLGFVPTTLQSLLPIVLEQLRDRFPDLKVFVSSGPSAKLATDIETGDLDFAFMSSPAVESKLLGLVEIGIEPLYLITANSNKTPTNVKTILQGNPYIGFSRETWLGRQIADFLNRNGFEPIPTIELDSIDAIENLVARDFGVSVVPQRLMAPKLSERMRCIGLGTSAPARKLVLASAMQCRRRTLRDALVEIAKPQSFEMPT